MRVGAVVAVAAGTQKLTAGKGVVGRSTVVAETTMPKR
jgi:hypothetical protein